MQQLLWGRVNTTQLLMVNVKVSTSEPISEPISGQPGVIKRDILQYLGIKWGKRLDQENNLHSIL